MNGPPARNGSLGILALFVSLFWVSLHANQENPSIDIETAKVTTRKPSIYAPERTQSEREEEITTLLSNTSGYQQLRSDEKTKLLKYVCGRNSFISTPARDGLSVKISFDPEKAAKPAMFREFLKLQPDAQADVGADDWEGVMAHNSPELSKPKLLRKFRFMSARTDAKRFTVKIGSNSIVLIVPVKARQKLGLFHTPDSVAKALGQLPDYCLKLIREVWIEPDFNPTDAEWRKLNHRTDHSYMTGGIGGIVRMYPCFDEWSWSYFAQCIVHESGHILSEDLWSENLKSKGWTKWKGAIKSDGLIPSQYARSTIEEDFGEMFQTYFLCKGQPEEIEIKAMFPARFAIIEKLIETEMSKGKQLYSKIKE